MEEQKVSIMHAYYKCKHVNGKKKSFYSGTYMKTFEKYDKHKMKSEFLAQTSNDKDFSEWICKFNFTYFVLTEKEIKDLEIKFS